jgi:hypothetical protein
MFFALDIIFDDYPDTMQLRNCVVDLASNTFRYGKPSDLTSRCSNILVPEDWLTSPEIIDEKSATIRAAAWSIVWSIFRREGPHHPDDLVDLLGDQDQQNFDLLMNILARVLEGRPLCRCPILTSKRGRNSKGLVDKILQSTMGGYHVPVKATVFQADRRSEHEHSAADIARQGARIAFGNEVLRTAWSNGVFKVKNSTDPILARGCGLGDSHRIRPTFTYMFGTNDPPAFEDVPKGSEEDRLLPLYLPNRFINKNEVATSPRCFAKDLDLEEQGVVQLFRLLGCSAARPVRCADARTFGY